MKLRAQAILPLLGGLLLLSSVAGCKSDAEKQLEEKNKELNDLRQLAEMDRREMENEYARFAAQYGEMKKGIRDDSLVARLDAEQKRAEQLMLELKNLKANSATEIMRLKRELETVRGVLRDYIRQVDSLQQVNQVLIGERDAALEEADRTRRENNTISERNADLSEQVAIAAQLNATGITISPLKNNVKVARKSKDVQKFSISFTITRNVTAQAGNRQVYVRLMKPNKQIAAPSGNFEYEGKNIEYSAVKTIEYSGQEQHVTLYVNISEYLSAGQYSAHIFADGQMIGSGTLDLSK